MYCTWWNWRPCQANPPRIFAKDQAYGNLMAQAAYYSITWTQSVVVPTDRVNIVRMIETDSIIC